MSVLVNSINTVSCFLADQQIEIGKDTTQDPPDCVVIAASSVLYGAETIFHHLQTGKLSTKTLVLCGGVGHSTIQIWEAVRRHHTYSHLASTVDGLPEARVLHEILKAHFNTAEITRTGCRILVEDKSTNCGANASETRKVLEQAGIPSPATMWIVQDPTMQRRTRASFQSVYEDMSSPPKFWSCPTFVPLVSAHDIPSSESIIDIVYATIGLPSDQLWSLERFVELIMGEIPRLRDDGNGYGPNGKGFISHVDIPDDVEAAWQLLYNHFQRDNSRQHLRSLADK